MGFAANSIGKYKLGRTIGEGTFAKVKLGVDSTSGKHVAVKIIDKHMVMECNLKSQAKIPISFSDFFIFYFLFFIFLPPTFIKVVKSKAFFFPFQVQREIRTMKLLHHPNIVRIHEVCFRVSEFFPSRRKIMSFLFLSLCV
jgi:serine/threonine protein kinase